MQLEEKVRIEMRYCYSLSTAVFFFLTAGSVVAQTSPSVSTAIAYGQKSSLRISDDTSVVAQIELKLESVLDLMNKLSYRDALNVERTLLSRAFDGIIRHALPSHATARHDTEPLSSQLAQRST